MYGAFVYMSMIQKKINENMICHQQFQQKDVDKNPGLLVYKHRNKFMST